MNYAAVEFKQLKSEAADLGLSRVRHGAYIDVMEGAKTKFDLPEDVSLNVDTIHTRTSHEHRKLLVAKRGPVSPIAAVEAHLLDVMLQLAVMRAPVEPKIGLEIANSMLKGTITEAQIVEWKIKHGVKCNEDDPAKLGQKYWHNFLK